MNGYIYMITYRQNSWNKRCIVEISGINDFVQKMYSLRDEYDEVNIIELMFTESIEEHTAELKKYLLRRKKNCRFDYDIICLETISKMVREFMDKIDVRSSDKNDTRII